MCFSKGYVDENKEGVIDNKELNEPEVKLTVVMTAAPYISDATRIELQELGSGFYWLRVKYGFMEDIDIP